MAEMTAPAAMHASWAFVTPELSKEDTADCTSFSTDVGSDMTASFAEQSSMDVGLAAVDGANAANDGWCWVVQNPGQITYSTPPKKERRPTPPQPVLSEAKIAAEPKVTAHLESPAALHEVMREPIAAVPIELKSTHGRHREQAASPEVDRDIAGAVVGLVAAAACGCFSGLTTCLASKAAVSVSSGKEHDVDSEYVKA